MHSAGCPGAAAGKEEVPPRARALTHLGTAPGRPPGPRGPRAAPVGGRAAPASPRCRRTTRGHCRGPARRPPARPPARPRRAPRSGPCCAPGPRLAEHRDAGCGTTAEVAAAAADAGPAPRPPTSSAGPATERAGRQKSARGAEQNPGRGGGRGRAGRGGAVGVRGGAGGGGPRWGPRRTPQARAHPWPPRRGFAAARAASAHAITAIASCRREFCTRWPSVSDRRMLEGCIWSGPSGSFTRLTCVRGARGSVHNHALQRRETWAPVPPRNN